jgi:hypothetical protein
MNKNPYTYAQARWMRAVLEAVQESITDALDEMPLGESEAKEHLQDALNRISDVLRDVPELDKPTDIGDGQDSAI